MTEQQINIALAKKLSELTGKDYRIEGSGPARNGPLCLVEFPDYDGPCGEVGGLFTEDLNTMKLIQDAMPIDTFYQFGEECRKFTKMVRGQSANTYTLNGWSCAALANLSAALKAEAACRALGIWVK